MNRSFGPRTPLEPEHAIRSRRRSRTARALGIGTLLLVLGGAALLATAMWTYATHDRPELIDDPDLIAVIEPACRVMTAEVERSALPSGAPSELRVAAIKRQNNAIRRMVSTIEQVGNQRIANDLPTRRWLDDWQRLASAREQYSVQSEPGARGPWQVPTAGQRSAGSVAEIHPAMYTDHPAA